MSNNNTFWWVALLAWIGGSTWWHTCKIKALCDTPVVHSAAVTDVHVDPLHIMDGGDLMLQSSQNINFATSGEKGTVGNVRSELDSLSRYLISNSERRLILTGRYAASETNTTSWPNLGIARAEDVKSYLVNKGVPAASIATKAKLERDLTLQDSLYAGIHFNFANQQILNENAVAESQKFESIFTTLDLYFNTGSANYIQTDANEQFIEEARKYLQENPDKKLLLTGHTDNVGNAAANLKLSKERAESVKQELIQASLNGDQLIVDAKGQTQPKADNNTEEGRATNRRVSIVVSK